MKKNLLKAVIVVTLIIIAVTALAMAMENSDTVCFYFLVTICLISLISIFIGAVSLFTVLFQAWDVTKKTNKNGDGITKEKLQILMKKYNIFGKDKKETK